MPSTLADIPGVSAADRERVDVVGRLIAAAMASLGQCGGSTEMIRRACDGMYDLIWREMLTSIAADWDDPTLAAVVSLYEGGMVQWADDDPGSSAVMSYMLRAWQRCAEERAGAG